MVALALVTSTMAYYLHLSLCHDSLATAVGVVFVVVQGLSVVGIAYVVLLNLFVVVPFVVTLVALEGSRGLAVVGLVPQIEALKRVLKPLLVVASSCHQHDGV